MGGMHIFPSNITHSSSEYTHIDDDIKFTHKKKEKQKLTFVFYPLCRGQVIDHEYHDLSHVWCDLN